MLVNRHTRFDPRTGVVIALAMLAAVLLVNNGFKLGLVLLSCGLVMGRMKKLTLWLNYCRLLLPLIGLLLLVGAIGGELIEAGLSVLKILTLGSIAFWFFQAIPPEELAFALMKWRLPFGVAFVIAYSLRYVELIRREWQTLREVQHLRGLVLKGWGWRHLPNLLGLMLVQVFRLSDELAEALETRGFGTPSRTAPFTFRLTLLDYMGMLGGMVAALIFYWG
jgi:energy-coupling factor transporter transmembrane protein EcfT